MWSVMFFIESIFLGIGLAMDAFSVSLANGLNEANMKKKKMCLVSLVFGVFQTLMPMIGWLCVHYLLKVFETFQMFIPYIAFILLTLIGGHMIYEALKGNDDIKPSIGFASLMIQGIATSIDALSVGFTIAEYDLIHALVSTIIIGTVTYIICMIGIIIGKKFGMKISNKATIVGGLILIIIGLEILITGII